MAAPRKAQNLKRCLFVCFVVVVVVFCFLFFVFLFLEVMEGKKGTSVAKILRKKEKKRRKKVT